MPSRQPEPLLGEADGDGLELPDVPGEGVPPVVGEAEPPEPDPLLAGLDGLVLPDALGAACAPWPAVGFPVAPVPGAVPPPSAAVTMIVVPGGTGACGVTEMTVPVGCPVLVAYSMW